MKTAVNHKTKAATLAAVLVSERYEATTAAEGIRKIKVVSLEEIGEGGDAIAQYEVQLPGWFCPRMGLVQFLWNPDGTIGHVIWWTHDEVQ